MRAGLHPSGGGTVDLSDVEGDIAALDTRVDTIEAALSPALQIPGLWGWWDPDLLTAAGKADSGAGSRSCPT